jgi:hypothetical protein
MRMTGITVSEALKHTLRGFADVPIGSQLGHRGLLAIPSPLFKKPRRCISISPSSRCEGYHQMVRGFCAILLNYLPRVRSLLYSDTSILSSIPYHVCVLILCSCQFRKIDAATTKPSTECKSSIISSCKHLLPPIFLIMLRNHSG